MRRNILRDVLTNNIIMKLFKLLQLEDATYTQKVIAVALVGATIINVILALTLLVAVGQGQPSGNNIPLI